MTRLILRAALAWTAIAAVEIVHGVLRARYLVPLVGDLASRQIGVLTGSLLILGVALALVARVGASGSRELRIVGGTWVALMLAFEVLLGRAFGMSWARIASDYDPRQGGLMLAGMAVLFLAPTIAARARASRTAARSARGSPCG